ncbi:MAG: DUF547 domain-containing protein [Calditrichaeota bacterium]|nr:MAG: DUF547 domain-containing protein [Calditrichota bacterium]
MKLKYLFPIIILFISCSSKEIVAFDHSYKHYAQLLQETVKDGLVDYKNIKASLPSYDSTYADFSSLDKGQYKSFTREQKIAYMINAYNFYTIKAIVDHYPVKSIKNIKGVWDDLEFPVAGEKMTLDNIEHDILRKEFKEERVHVAVVCASISCPELWDKPFLPDSLDAHLNLRAEAFARDSLRNSINFEKKEMKLSKILDWYSSDFKGKYDSDDVFPYLSGEKRSVANFIYQHLDDTTRQKFKGKKMKVGHLGYDWNLNEQK